jgi:two-component system sensor kinase FixL
MQSEIPYVEQLDQLTEMIPVGIIRMDKLGNCLFVNRHWCELTGLSPEQAYGDCWARALHPDDRDEVIESWRAASSNDREFAYEFRFLSPEGGIKAVSSRVLPLFDASGRVHSYLGAVTDITQQKQTEKALRMLTYQLGERVKELHCLIGISRVMEQSGGSLARILRETVELLRQSWEYSEIACARIVMGDVEFKTDNYANSPWKQTADIIVHGEEAGVVEVCYLREMPEQDEGPFLAEERSIINAVAERLGRMAERLRAERQVREREDELRQRLTHLTRVSVMGEMASSIAHEINQPLTAISTYAQACRRMVEAGMLGESNVVDVLARIAEEALRAGDIVHHLRNLIRKRESQTERWDVNDLVREVEHLAVVDARLRDVTLRLDLSEALPEIHADGIQIQQVILNLIRNGVDALEGGDVEDREVVVRTVLRDGREIEVSVSDNGCGLPSDFEDKMFQPFYTTKESGMGMGLSISRTIVASHGGRMWFERNPNRGTTFHFTIPTVNSDEQHAE